VQIAALAVDAHLILVAAAIRPIAGMQGLVHVADEVHDKTQRLGTFCQRA
jgi:hypothetical protein